MDIRDVFSTIEDTFFSQYSWTYVSLCTNDLADILSWLRSIRERKKGDAKQQLVTMEMLIHAIHSQDPGKLAETMRNAIHEIDNIGEKNDEEEIHGNRSKHVEGYYPDEEVDLGGIDKIKSMREEYGMQ